RIPPAVLCGLSAFPGQDRADEAHRVVRSAGRQAGSAEGKSRLVYLGADGTTGARAAGDAVRAHPHKRRRATVAKIVQLYEDGISDTEYDRFANLVELALTPDELETFENSPPETIETTLGRLQRALGKRSRIARSTVRRICGLT